MEDDDGSDHIRPEMKSPQPVTEIVECRLTRTWGIRLLAAAAETKVKAAKFSKKRAEIYKLHIMKALTIIA